MKKDEKRLNAMSNRLTYLPKLAKVKGHVEGKLDELLKKYPKVREIPNFGSFVGTVYYLKDKGVYPYSGLIMFMFRYYEDMRTISVECVMEVNLKTIPDLSDTITFPEESIDYKKLDEFLAEKIKVFDRHYKARQE